MNILAPVRWACDWVQSYRRMLLIAFVNSTEGQLRDMGRYGGDISFIRRTTKLWIWRILVETFVLPLWYFLTIPLRILQFKSFYDRIETRTKFSEFRRFSGLSIYGNSFFMASNFSLHFVFICRFYWLSCHDRRMFALPWGTIVH